IGFSELMAGDLLGPMSASQYKSYAQDINDSGNHLLTIVNDILDLSRIEAGVTELDEGSVDIASVCNSSLRTVRGRAELAGIALHRSIPADLPALRGDTRLVTQILLNLLSNAIKFTPQGGHVTLEVRCDGEGAVVFRVEDTGIGISASDLQRVTEPFMQ